MLKSGIPELVAESEQQGILYLRKSLVLDKTGKHQHQRKHTRRTQHLSVCGVCVCVCAGFCVCLVRVGT